MSQTAAPPETGREVPPDPLLKKSYSVPIALAMFAVVGATLLAVADEMWMRRPYKKIQAQYRETYAAYLEKVEADRRGVVEDTVKNLDAYKALDQKVRDAQTATGAATREIEAALKTATDKGRKLVEAVKVSKSEIAALSYEAEDKAHSNGFAKVEDCPECRPLLDEIARINAREITYSWSAYAAADLYRPAKEETATGKVADLLAEALDIEQRKAALQTTLGEAGKPVSDAAKAKDEWLARHVGDLEYALQNADDETKRKIAASGVARYLDENAVSLGPDAVAAIRAKVEADYPSATWAFMGGRENQIHVKEAANWVDRCETCHLNARAPLPVTVESLRSTLGKAVKSGDAELPGWDAKKIESMPLGLFTSHPNVELLKKHDPDRFGCSMCHNGNGVAITSAELAHGENHHWLWPLFPKENVEAGCVQCHQKDLHLDHGERINAGRDEFRRGGCWGCHKYEGFNTEPDQITALEGRKKDIETAKGEKSLRESNLRTVFGSLPDDAPNAKREQNQTDAGRWALTQEIAGLDVEKDQVERRLRDVHVERQRVGPNLKDLKAKILREFLTDWIRSPRDAHKDASGRAFRPETKMPTFRWTDDEEVKDVAAYLWQRSLDRSKFPEYGLPAFQPGDAVRGKELLEKRGCLVCHSMGAGAARVGNDYAANLSNLGEKDRPEFVARWVNHPRRRLVAYDPTKKAGERDVSGVAEGDPRYVWTQHAIMPNFRLPADEVRDITTYLVSQRRGDVRYEEPTWLDDEKRAESGKKLVLYQGCAGCHEISGLEDEKGIGTELTEEGSKPIERLDFGHHTIPAKRGEEPLRKGEGLLEDAGKLFENDDHWYRPRGFFLHKVAKPDFFDEAKLLPNRFDRLRMPQFRFDAQQVLDVTTLILGSIKSEVPESFRYDPDDAGRAVREGWWIVKKYNCQGCHQIQPSDVPSLWSTPRYSDWVKENGGRDRYAPPSLVGVGARLRPDFLAEFLRDPSLGGDRANPTSVRAHLEVRMPTFDFSEDEIRKLVLFFGAMAKQPAVYQPPKPAPLTEAEHRAASAIWKAQGSCNQCHIGAGGTITLDTKAPNLAYAPRRLRPEWARRWIANPPAMQPATAMTLQFGWWDPQDKFHQAEPGPDGKYRYMTKLPELQGIDADHVDLMIRYLAAGLAGK